MVNVPSCSTNNKHSSTVTKMDSKTLYRWEQSAGLGKLLVYSLFPFAVAVANVIWYLEHTCGTCPCVKPGTIYVYSDADSVYTRTKQNDPKARQSCYGIHTEPCPRYHQIMHFVGASHNCYPCIISNEQHEKRHTGVLQIPFRDKDPRANLSV